MNVTLPAFILAATPGINFLGIESILLDNCKELGEWPKRIRLTKWISGAIILVLSVMMYRDIEKETGMDELVVFSKYVIPLMAAIAVLWVATFAGLGMSIFAMNQC